nr:hypothetical protein [uncultured Pseudomonas sp.]
MGMKPPKKVTNPDRPKTDQPDRNNPAEGSTHPQTPLPSTGMTGLHPDGRLITPEHPLTPGSQAPAIEIFDLPGDTLISRTTTGLPLTNYYLAPRLAERLPAADPATALRSIASGRQYVDLENGWTVLVGLDAQGHLRARQTSELAPSGPRLERVAGTLEWRPVQPDSHAIGDSELIISRRPLPDEDEATPAKRPRRTDESEIDETSPTDPPAPLAPQPPRAEPWKNWGISPQHMSPEDITAGDLRYRVLPHGSVPAPLVVYVKNPAHPDYDFDSLQGILIHDIEQQPRGAIQIPPTQRWEVDPTLPFRGPLPTYVATYFPELTTASLVNVARQQFYLANSSDKATSAGLTTLRQTFNDWKTSNISPRPGLADPLLMLAVTQMPPGLKANRILEFPALPDRSPLHRLEFDPEKFTDAWRYFISTQSAVDLKRFMARLLIRNGYTVFKPTDSTTFPALVFKRTGHDFVFYMTLHRAHGRRLHIPESSNQALLEHRMSDFIGPRAVRAVQDARTANKLIWLRGGSHIVSGSPSSVFIVRMDNLEI